MKLYELTYLILPDVSEEDLKSVQEKINSLIQTEGGVLAEGNYPVKKEGGYLVTLNFNLEPDRVSSLEKKLKSESKIIRYMILVKKLEKKIFISNKPPRLVKPPSDKILQDKIPTEKTKVELNEIEKKLEEILGE